MNFAEAVKCLKEDQAIRRKSWPDLAYLKMIENEVKGYRQEAVLFNYNVNIITSDDWIVCGTHPGDIIDFPAAIERMKHRHKIRLKEWPKHTYIELAPNGQDIFFRKMCEYNFTPTFECFSALDWEVLE